MELMAFGADAEYYPSFDYPPDLGFLLNVLCNDGLGSSFVATLESSLIQYNPWSLHTFDSFTYNKISKIQNVQRWN